MRIFYPGSPDIPAGLAPNGKPWPTLRLEQLEAIYRLKRVVLDGIKVDGMPDRYHSALVGAGMGSGAGGATGAAGTGGATGAGVMTTTGAGAGAGAGSGSGW